MSSNNTMPLTGHVFLGSKPSRGGEKSFRAVDPALDREIDPHFYEATLNEIDRALKLAESAFVEYRKLTGRQRGQFLRSIAVHIEALGDELISRAAAETALPAARLTGERARTCGQLRLMADLVEDGSWMDARIDHADTDRKPVPKPDVRRMRMGLGPVVVFAASNFPLAFSVAGGDTASALAAGCTVVVKAHPSHPGTSELVMSAMLGAVRSCAMPDGVVSMLHGVDPEVSLALVRHPLTQAVGFTGSLRAGRALFDAAAARANPIPVHAEMGSTNPVFLLPKALAERGGKIAEGLKNSVMLGVGQFCTKPGVVVAVDDAAARSFVKHLSALMSAQPVGTMLNRRIAKAFADGCATRAKETDALRASATTASATQACAVLFTTTARQFLSDHDLREELFGPSTLLVLAESIPQLHQVAQALDGQLTATVHAAAGELKEHPALLETLQRKAGRLILNGYPTGVEVCPAMHHGGPYPATTDSRTTSVGTAAIERFARPVCFQDFAAELLPAELQDANPLGIWRIVDGRLTR